MIKLLRSILRYDFKREIRCFSPSLRVAVPSPLQGETEVRELLRYRFTLGGGRYGYTKATFSYGNQVILDFAYKNIRFNFFGNCEKLLKIKVRLRNFSAIFDE